MASSGPVIEELPDDYDVQAEKERVWSAVSAPPASSAASQPDGGGTLRKGFFSSKPKPSAPANTSKPAPAESHSSKPAPAASQAKGADASAKGADASESEKSEMPPEAPRAHEPGPEVASEVGEVVAGLRARLLKASDNARKARRQKDVAECTESLKESVAAMASQPRWPTGQAKAARDRAAREADSALAELRAASNDARRMRSGEEKRALVELRKTADDGVDRVKKLCESVAPKDKTPEDEAKAVVASFHSLPLTVKLRLLVDEKVALALLAASFVSGVALMSGILLEFYVAWGCGFQCER